MNYAFEFWIIIYLSGRFDYKLSCHLIFVSSVRSAVISNPINTEKQNVMPERKYTSAVWVSKKMQTQTFSITESKHFCFRKPAKIQYKPKQKNHGTGKRKNRYWTRGFYHAKKSDYHFYHLSCYLVHNRVEFQSAFGIVR